MVWLYTVAVRVGVWSDYISVQLGLVCGLGIYRCSKGWCVVWLYTVALRVGVWSDYMPLQLGLVCGLTIYRCS